MDTSPTATRTPRPLYGSPFLDLARSLLGFASVRVALCLLLGTAALSAQTTYTVSSSTIVGYPAIGPKFVINADRAKDSSTPFSNPFFNRWYLTAQTNVTAIASGAFSVSVQGRFRLVDENGVVVPCEGADVTGYVGGSFSTFSAASAGVYGTTRTAHLVPTVTLNPAALYRLEVKAVSTGRSGTLATGQTTNDFRFVHFTGPDGTDINGTLGSDASVNVVAHLETGASYSRLSALRTDANSNFNLAVPYTVYRYDEPESLVSSSAVTLRFVVELYDAAAPTVPIPTENAVTDLAVLTSTYNPSFISSPSTLTGTATLTFRPVAGTQLDSVGKTYFAKVTLGHYEDLADFVPQADDVMTLAATHLLHFNGALIFGAATANPINTTFTGIGNNPAPGLLSATSIATSVVVTAASVNGSGHTFTANPALGVALLANGDALVQSGSATLTPLSLPDRATVGGVRIDRTSIVLNSAGATAGNLSVILPAGMGWAATATNKTLNPRFDFASVGLKQSLLPIAASLLWLPPGGTGWVMEESKPMLVNVASVTWAIPSGHFNLTLGGLANNAAYVRSTELTQLEGSPIPAAQKIMRSNEQYWRWAQLTTVTTTSQFIIAGTQGGAEYYGGFDFANPAAQTFRTHFPYAAAMVVATGKVLIVADLINPTFSTLGLVVNSHITMPWLNGCLEPSCNTGSPPPSTIQTFTPATQGTPNPTLRLTPDGGLVGAGTFDSGLNLRWGYLPTLSTPAIPVYAHKVNSIFTQGTFAMGGICLNGAVNSTGDPQVGASIMLLTGVDATTGAATERAATPAYQVGRAEYAGFNVNLGTNDAASSGINGTSTLASKTYGPYALKHRCKYYVRASGVAGIHDKVAGPAETILLYGYEFTLTNFGLSFLNNGVKASRVNGQVVVPKPSEIHVDFEELSFFCNGGLDKAKIASSSNSPAQKLMYWKAPIDIRAMQFIHPDSCDPSKGFLTLGLNSYASHITSVLSGTVGFHSHGNLLNKEFSDAQSGSEMKGFDSRFKLPKQVSFQGPPRKTTQGGFEEYIFTPAVDAYLNITGTPATNWVHNPPNDVEDGFWNFGGRLKVSFFEAPMIHLQTTANLPPADITAPSPWQNSVIKIANGTWDTGAGNTSYFDGATYHDTWNRGLPYPAPYALVNVPPDQQTRTFYNKDARYLPIAKQKWLGGAIKFQYKLLWNSSTRSFTTLDASESQEDSAAAQLAQEMVIIKINHRLPYLSAERAELTFGAEYSGMPKVNLANFVVNQLDDATGVFAAATHAGCDAIFQKVDDGLASLAKLLNDQTRDYFTAALDPVVLPVTNTVYDQLHTLWLNGQWNDVTVGNLLNPQLGAVGTLHNDLRSVLDGTKLGFSQFEKIILFLHDTDVALQTINEGFLKEENGTIPVAKDLVRELLKMLSKQLGGTIASLSQGADSQISKLIDPLLEGAQPTLKDLKVVIGKIQVIIHDVQTALAPVGDLATEIKDLVTNQVGELDTLSNEVNAEFKTYLKQFTQGLPGKNFLSHTKAEFRLKLEQAIYDRFFGTQLLTKIQSALKQRLQDVEGAIHSGIDSIFGEINKVIKKAISGLLAEVDDKINGVLGEFGKYLGSGSIQGYATFNGDALRKLRVDGKFEFKVPDAVHIEGFLEINQYSSKDTPPGCNKPVGTEKLTEVTIGAINVPTDFLSPGVKMNLNAKFSFITIANGKIHPVGLGGGIVMAKGPIDFEAFKITKLAVGVAFGATENYFSAALGLEMGSWGANGGVFFGRTCTLDPITLWDPFAAKAIGNPNPSFTGIYVYGEVHIPVSEVLLGIPASCFFEISADAGVGFFVFAEGPSYGARMALGVDGEVLCILGISGRVDLLGGKVNGQTKLSGRGEFCASILGIDVCKDVTISTGVQSDGSMKGDGDAK